MSLAIRFRPSIFALAAGALTLAACALSSPPTLEEVRTGRARAGAAIDTALRPGELSGEVTALDPNRREIRVRTDDGRARVLLYDRRDTLVTYHGRDYPAERLEAGDVIAFRTRPRGTDEVETIRVLEPVQARSASVPAGRRTAARADIVEGTVERVQYDTGVFELRPRSGRPITVSVPYNARAADVDNFRRLREGDYVRVEGEFTNPDNLQLLAFLSR